MVPNRPDQGHTDEVTASSKSKRVRTGCLTCRERHLKCDENQPICNNCRKSSRVCKRGIRLNFIDTTVKDPPLIPKPADWRVYFQDESRNIAAEYKGGLDKYKKIFPEVVIPPTKFDHSNLSPCLINQSVRKSESNSMPYRHFRAPTIDNVTNITQESTRSRQTSQHLPTVESDIDSYTTPPRTISCSESISKVSPLKGLGHSYLKTAQEVLFMQVFVEEVGIWMDNMDSMKHFSRQLPYLALEEPMLLNAFLACGARHLTLVNPKHHEENALSYYDTATTQLLQALKNPERDTVCCATTAVVLNVYEIMSESAMHCINHIAGARALIKECGWNAKSTGIGAACFWLNVGMELLSCLHFNRQMAWDPDYWGVDLNFERQYDFGNEEVWVHRILYIVGKITNFRASAPKIQEKLSQEEKIKVQDRLTEWLKLKSFCDNWDRSVPRTMKPMGYLHPSQTNSHSAFPEVWVIKRATIVGRLFYHTAMILLAQIHPLKSRDIEEMRIVQLDHAHMICGITAHIKDRGVASVALRSLAIAAECLMIRREQEEILTIFEKIRKETGCRLGFLHKELRVKWGWDTEKVEHCTITQRRSLEQLFPAVSRPKISPRQSIQNGILNPMLAKADSSLLNHPFQQYNQPPNQHSQNFSHSYT